MVILLGALDATTTERAGKYARMHADACRKRIEEAMEEDEKGRMKKKKAEQRMTGQGMPAHQSGEAKGDGGAEVRDPGDGEPGDDEPKGPDEDREQEEIGLRERDRQQHQRQPKGPDEDREQGEIGLRERVRT